MAMRTQCEAFMQALAGVDSQQSYGRDLANNFFDVATIAATVSQSPAMWATGLSTTQTTFNSVSVSTERYLMLTDSVGALRQRVLDEMEKGVVEPDFAAARDGAPGRLGRALNIARQSIAAVQAYGSACTEGGIRLVISEALTASPIATIAEFDRTEGYRSEIQRLVREALPADQRSGFRIGSRDVSLLFLYSYMIRQTEPNPDLPAVRAAIPYIDNMGANDRQLLLSYVTLLSALEGQGAAIRSEAQTIETQFRQARLQPPAQEQPAQEQPAQDQPTQPDQPDDEEEEQGDN